MRIIEHEKEARAILRKAETDSPDLCARILTAYAAGLNKIEYIMAWDKELTFSQAAFLKEIVQRRAHKEPLAYILGKKEFYGRDFKVTSDTLIPRPETELLIDEALRLLPNKNVRFADLGCGSGCIGITLALERPNWNGSLLDLNKRALKISALNARFYDCSLNFVQGDIFHPCFHPSSLDLIICNPPYISIDEKNTVMEDVLGYEPHQALFSTENGLGHINAAVCFALTCLKSNGWLILEHGALQGNSICRLLNSKGFKNIKDIPDLSGISRCITAQKQE